MAAPFSHSRIIAWSVWIIASIFYAYQYILRVMPSIMITDIMHRFEIDAAMFGQFSGVYYIGYSLLHLPIGIMLDRFGPRKIMTACILLAVIGLLPLIFSTHWIYPIMGRFLIGLGSSAAILGVFKIIRMAFSEARFARMLGLSVTIGLMGAIYGGGPVSYMREKLGYQVVVQLFALLGIALAAMTYWIVPNVKSALQNSILSDIKEVLGNSRVIWSCIFAGLMVGPLEGFADVWGSAFLKQIYGLDISLAASLLSLIFIGMCFGSPLLSLVAEKIGNYLIAIIGAGLLMVAGFSLLLVSHLSPSILSAAFVLIGICCAYQILAIYTVSSYVRAEVAGLATAVANMIIMIFGYVFHSTIGAVVSTMGGPGQSAALLSGVAVIPIALLVGTSGFIFLLAKDKKNVLMANEKSKI